MSEGSQGPHTIGWHTEGSTHATTWCGCPLASLELFFGLRLVSGENRNFGLHFVQFREYFIKMPRSVNKTQSKRCINKHGSSKNINTFETYHLHE
jgi:hypothetical protein